MCTGECGRCFSNSNNKGTWKRELRSENTEFRDFYLGFLHVFVVCICFRDGCVPLIGRYEERADIVLCVIEWAILVLACAVARIHDVGRYVIILSKRLYSCYSQCSIGIRLGGFWGVDLGGGSVFIVGAGCFWVVSVLAVVCVLFFLLLGLVVACFCFGVLFFCVYVVLVNMSTIIIRVMTHIWPDRSIACYLFFRCWGRIKLLKELALMGCGGSMLAFF